MRRAILACGVVLAAGCDADRGTDVDPLLGPVPRVRVEAVEIPLAFEVDPDLLEFSALAWWGDRLLLVPQQPHVVDPTSPEHWYSIERASLARWLDGGDRSPLRPQRLPFDDAGTRSRIEGWDGYEAVAVHGDSLVVSVERVVRGKWGSVLVRGVLEGDPPRARLDPSVLVEVEGHSRRPNFSEEALVSTARDLVALHEINGRRANPRARAHRFAWDLGRPAEVAMPILEYRITDATSADAHGRFWVINQFWPPEFARVRPAADPLAAERREAGVAVERLVALRLDPSGVHLDLAEGVIEIALRSDGVVRNWEGIARWEDRGFLVVTDRYPSTTLAFVPRR